MLPRSGAQALREDRWTRDLTSSMCNEFAHFSYHSTTLRTYECCVLSEVPSIARYVTNCRVRGKRCPSPLNKYALSHVGLSGACVFVCVRYAWSIETMCHTITNIVAYQPASVHGTRMHIITMNRMLCFSRTFAALCQRATTKKETAGTGQAQARHVQAIADKSEGDLMSKPAQI